MKKKFEKVSTADKGRYQAGNHNTHTRQSSKHARTKIDILTWHTQPTNLDCSRCWNLILERKEPASKSGVCLYADGQYLKEVLVAT